ncbi:MAG: phosphotransferase [Clostridia bacterium]|nr:phosphotransferase [Clostridia bacterium]
MREIISQDVPKIEALLEKVFSDKSYRELSRLGGLTNHTYRVLREDGSEYVLRIPGEGTEELICRADERVSTDLACRLGIDASLLYFGEDGAKVTRYLPEAETMNSLRLKQAENIRRVARIFQILHRSGENTGVPFEVFDMAKGYERIISSMKVSMFEDYSLISQRVLEIKREIDRDVSAPVVPCHNDPLCENWVLSQGKMYLIDWEYAGMNDGMWDVADVSIEAGYSEKEDRILLEEYLERKPTLTDRKHFLANKIYVDYLWTLWAKARVPYDGQPMEDWATERYARLKANLEQFVAVQEERS